MSKTQAIRLKKVHRSIGILLVLFLLILATTGILLNHSDGLGLAERDVPPVIAAWYYGDDALAIGGYDVNGEVLYVFGSMIYLGERAVTACVGSLDGALALEDQIVALCSGELKLLSPDGQLIESLGSAHGVPAGTKRLGRQGNRLVLDGPDGTLAFDLVVLAAEEARGAVVWQQEAEVPAARVEGLLTGVVSWEKLIRDIHSGRILAPLGVWIVDLVAILLVVMSVSGLVLGRLPYRNGSGDEQP